jgi:hypothetical protein
MEYQWNTTTPIKTTQEINMTDLESVTCIKRWRSEVLDSSYLRYRKKSHAFSSVSHLPHACRLDFSLQCIFLYSLPVVKPSYWHVCWLWQTFRAKSALGWLTRLRTLGCNTTVGVRDAHSSRYEYKVYYLLGCETVIFRTQLRCRNNMHFWSEYGVRKSFQKYIHRTTVGDTSKIRL